MLTRIILGSVLAGIAAVGSTAESEQTWEQANQAASVVVGGKGGLCSSIAYVRQQAQKDFADIKGALSPEWSNAEKDAYLSKFRLLDGHDALIEVPTQGSDGSRYHQIMQLKDTVTARNFLDLWRENVATCYGETINVVCTENSCTGTLAGCAGRRVFWWVFVNTTVGPGGAFFVYKTPLTSADLKWLPIPSPEAAVSPATLTSVTAGGKTWTLADVERIYEAVNAGRHRTDLGSRQDTRTDKTNGKPVEILIFKDDIGNAYFAGHYEPRVFRVFLIAPGLLADVREYRKTCGPNSVSSEFDKRLGEQYPAWSMARSARYDGFVRWNDLEGILAQTPKLTDLAAYYSKR